MENITQIWKKIQSPEFNPATDMNLVETVKQVALTSQEPAKVSFGTSGWRGEIGSEFTLRNLQVVGAAIVRLYKEATPELFAALGVKDFAELQKRGVVVGHDNRLLGHEFCEAVADQFAKAGVKVYYGGEMPTPEFSAAIEMLGAACSINMTPSHNPSHYNGIKFNPADGGPAGPEITNVITKLSNEMMATWKFEPVSSSTASRNSSRRAASRLCATMFTVLPAAVRLLSSTIRNASSRSATKMILCSAVSLRNRPARTSKRSARSSTKASLGSVSVQSLTRMATVSVSTTALAKST